MSGLFHEAVSASAGSGKTYKLSSRYIALMARALSAGLDPQPERIAALTFSRKAAGEIFSRILERLADAALSEARLAELNAALEQEGVSSLESAQAAQLLRVLISRMPRLRLGTLDSFFAQVIRAFPFELGLNGDFEMIDGVDLTDAREDTLGAVLTSASGEQRQALTDALRDLSFGDSPRSFRESLLQCADTFHQLYLQAQDRECWGIQAVWPRACIWIQAAGDYSDSEIATFREKHTDRSWETFFRNAADYQPGKSIDLGTVGNRLLEQFAGVVAGSAEIKVGRKQEALDAADCDLLRRVLGKLVAQALAVKDKRVQAVYRLLSAYESKYREQVRNRGRLSFADFKVLLADGPGLTGIPSEGRLYIDYRLDGKFDHWLLDEFQDTDRMQWQVLCNLIDEVVQADSPERTFFYVGDIKQAIYNWRGGDARLFGEVAGRYGMELTSLARSWRSAPAVLETVNQVFGALDGHPALPEAVRMQWDACWDRHEPAPGNAGKAGCAVLYEIGRSGNLSDDKDERIRFTVGLVGDLLREKGGSIAVLVRSGKFGREVLDALRQAGISCVWEGETPALDSPELYGFYSLVKLAEHPGDRFAQEHIRISPLAAHLEAEGLVPENAGLAVLREINRAGFEAALRRFVPSPGRAALYAAREFDATRNRSCDDFLRYLEELTIPGGGAGQVTVMTIHKSKGLEFDAVVLPELQGGKGLDSVELGFEQHTGAGHETEWVFDVPGKTFAEADPVLRSHLESRRETAIYEALCVLYVAMTRAKQGLYMVITSAAGTSTSLQLSALLTDTLSSEPQPVPSDGQPCSKVYSSGDSDWMPEKEAQPEPEKTEWPPFRFETRKRLIRRLPSEEEQGADAGLLFAPERMRAAETGLQLHQLFEQIEWLEADEAAPEAEGSEYICRLFGQAMQSDAIRSLFARPGADAEVWREKPFEVVIDGVWISGRFDRVVLRHAADGRICGAEIIDFKCGNATELKESEMRQMQLYRKVLSRLTGLAEEQILCRIARIRSGRVDEI